jgi:hypothetical protein
MENKRKINYELIFLLNKRFYSSVSSPSATSLKLTTSKIALPLVSLFNMSSISRYWPGSIRPNYNLKRV